MTTMKTNTNSFGVVASALAGALVALAACNTNTATQPPLTVKPGASASAKNDVGFQAGDSKATALSFNLRLDADASGYELKALPSETEAVDIEIDGPAFKGKKVTATVQKSDFKSGVAAITIENLPIGKVNVAVVVRGAGGKELGRGVSSANVEAGKTNPVKITVKAAPTSGALAIEVDGGGIKPSALLDQRIDRLAIPSLVLVFYGYNGFTRGVLGDPAAAGAGIPAAVAPLDLVKQVGDGTIKDPSKTAIKKGFDGMDKYNSENPAQDRSITAPYYKVALKAVFARDDAAQTALSELLTPDVQVLDMSKDTMFLQSGRALTDDVVDTELKALSGVDAATDKVSANDKPFTTSFPYLARPW